MTRPAPRIAILGSINMDLVLRCASLPGPGETVLAKSSAEICGGKGANQAVAAARAGGDVTMIGRVGDDAFASRLVANLRQENINCGQVKATSRCSSGLAIVAVEQSGQNSIVVVSGANGRLSVADVETAREEIESSDVLLLQLEVPIASVLAAIEIARAAGVRIILDPAPAPAECPDQLLQVDLICPNQSEATAILGDTVDTDEQVEAAAQALQQQGAKNVAVTLGERGTLLWDGANSQHIKPFPVTAVDTTAAGDAFAGALAVFWGEGNGLADAVRFANGAGALAASREGAQPGMPKRDDIERLWRT
jgi:ribokinase